MVYVCVSHQVINAQKSMFYVFFNRKSVFYVGNFSSGRKVHIANITFLWEHFLLFILNLVYDPMID